MQNDRTLLATEEALQCLIARFKAREAEIHMVVQRSVVQIVYPANDLASRSAQRLTAVRANHGEHLIQEQMPLRTQFLVRCRLHEEQIVPIQVGIPLPRVHSFIENQSARIICLFSDILVLFDDLLYTVLIDLLGFNLHGLNVLLQFMLYPLAKAVGDAVLIAVERLLQRDVSVAFRFVMI